MSADTIGDDVLQAMAERFNRAWMAERTADLYEGRVADPEDFSHGKPIGVECCATAYDTPEHAEAHERKHTRS